MIRVALSVWFKFANLTRHDVILLVDAFGAPRTKVMINQWTRPIVSVRLKVSWMKVQVTVRAVLCNDFRYGATAVGTLR